ncbi:MAG: hypothetical protein NC115_06050 [Bacteroidales bacterium]|nr:hypothetical protein [Bacteroides sp.]MCM1199424.1 hypothetical protein [Clostridium sp.]MCM1502212.1 hypothetical protein [Bacteroidales bacterium]
MKLYYLLPALLLSGCVVAEMTAEQEQPQQRRGLPQTRSAGAITDTAAVMSFLQSDTELMLISQIYYKDGVMIIALSKEDALDLGIPEDMYDKYCEEIRQVNEARKKNR